MFKKRQLATEWHRELRGKRLTEREAERLALFDTAAKLHEIGETIAEIKLKMVVIDKFLERTASDWGYRDPADMRGLSSGG